MCIALQYCWLAKQFTVPWGRVRKEQLNLASVEVSTGACLYLHCSDKETQRILLIQRAVSLSSWAFLAWMLVSQ